jgi:hypothetical protein
VGNPAAIPRRRHAGGGACSAKVSKPDATDRHAADGFERRHQVAAIGQQLAETCTPYAPYQIVEAQPRRAYGVE